MSDIGIHVTITLNASPLLIDVMMSIVDLLSDRDDPDQQKGETELNKLQTGLNALKPPTDVKPDIEDPSPANTEVNKKSTSKKTLCYITERSPFETGLEYLTDISPNLRYGETENGSLCIRYLSGVIYTTWDDAENMYTCYKKSNYKPSVEGNAGNKQTALNQFMKAMDAGLKRKEYSDPVDPDDDFRPHLKSVIDTSTGYDGGKIEGSLDG